MSYEVYCLENFSWGESYTWGSYETYEEALEVAKYIVDLCLMEGYSPSVTPEALYSSFMMFGDTPCISGPYEGPKFSGREYARARAREICACAQAAGVSEERVQ